MTDHHTRRPLAAAIGALMLLAAAGGAQAHAPYVMTGFDLPSDCLANEVVWKSGKVYCRYGREVTKGGPSRTTAGGSGSSERSRPNVHRPVGGPLIIVIDGFDALERLLLRHRANEGSCRTQETKVKPSLHRMNEAGGRLGRQAPPTRPMQKVVSAP